MKDKPHPCFGPYFHKTRTRDNVVGCIKSRGPEELGAGA